MYFCAIAVLLAVVALNCASEIGKGKAARLYLSE
jgi:hypothetical protein